MKSYSALLALAAVSLPTPAFAHWGHVGELAGHGHIIAIGAAAAAAALTAALLKPDREKQAEDETEAEEELEAA